MNKFAPVLISLCLAASANLAFAGDSMSMGKDSMSRDSMGGNSASRDSMNRDSAGGNSMGKDSLSRDSGGKDTMSKDSMNKDSMGMKDMMGKTPMGRDKAM